MKVRKLKTRIAAFGLAVLMGISTLSSANAFAAEQTGSEQQTEVQASEQAVTSQKDTSVTADDITKAVSDDTFAVETSMEGIHYDAEKEDVTLVSIKDENGGEYHSDKAGTYIATYMVVPKDKSDSYTITRKVTLTDTEGQAHSEENGGEKQKSDTESEDDSDSPVQNYTDVEIETSEEDASAQAIKELKEDIEEGNVMVLSAAERATSSGSTVTLTKGRTIYYPSYIGNYLTCLFTVNGKIAYCLQSQKASPPSGSYVAQVLDSNKNLQKVLYYGYGGAGDLTGSYLSGKTEDEKYVYTHIAASYAYAGEAGFTGCNYNDLVNAGVIAYINYLFGQEEPPKGELSLSSTKLNAVRDGNIQKTPNITLSGDHRNYVTLSVPENVTAHNLSKGTSVTNGKIQIYGGDTFYLSADLLLTGSYASGNLYGSVGKTWRTLVLTTGDSKQDIGVFESETNCVLCISIGIIVCILLSACSRQPDFDAKSYVQSSLDAHYHGEYKDYANLLEISEKDAKKEIEEDFNESIQQQFDDSDNITDKGIADYAEKLTEVKKLAKYKVQDVKEEDGVYTVSVQVEPSNVFQTLQQSSTEVSNEKIKQGLDGNDPEVFAAVLTESVQKSLEKNRYGKAVTVNVSVEKDNSGKYGLLDTEMNKLEAAMFPTE